MRHFIFFLFLPLMLFSENPSWYIYYGDAVPIEAFTPYDPIVFDSIDHPPLGPLLQKKKEVFGYLSLGEIAERDQWFSLLKGKKLLLNENPDWKGSFAVDIRKPFWKRLILDTIIPNILAQGFTGIFLDQLDVSLDLKMADAAVDLIKAIRKKFPHIRIMMNRAYEILPRVGDLIDDELAETLYTSYDFETKEYFVRPNNEYEWQLSVLDAARKKFPKLQFFSLDYWDLRDTEMVEKIYSIEKNRGFRPFVSTILLDVVPRAGEHLTARNVLAFWDSKVDKKYEDSLVHRSLEMPLNHLGLNVIYADIHSPLPDLTNRSDIRGVLLCFQETTKMSDPRAFIEWAINAIDFGKKMIILHNPGFLADLNGIYTSGDVQNRLFQKMGFINTEEWIDYPFDYKIICDDGLASFEKDYPYPLPGFYITKILDPAAKSYLKVAIPNKSGTESDLVIISPQGAYVSDAYINNFDTPFYLTDPKSMGWYLNPFSFFKLSLGLEEFPIPDATTLAGRRIFYACCHGDNWNGPTSLEEYREKEEYCAEVILNKIIKPYPDLPIAVGVVGATVDPKWVGRLKSQEITRNYFELPQLEAASHSYSHPFNWDFFKSGGPKKEVKYLYLYPYGTWQFSYLSWFHSKYKPKAYGEGDLAQGYVIPRAYANEPFNLDKEISGAANYLNQFAPPNNQVKLLLWPGDARPWATPVDDCIKAGLKQFGGGSVRFDPDYPSYLFVGPLGRKPGGLIQPYASANAENDYTEGWTNNFFGYQYLPATLKNTESPRRLKPVNLYYHSYSGEYQSSLSAILHNIDYIKTQLLIPIQVGRFCDIVEGFYSTEIESIGCLIWKIKNRSGLQTFRFDHSQYVDFSTSEGVIGFNEHEGSLYIYLDAAVAEPIIALSNKIPKTSYLIDSSWEIWDLKREGKTLTFKTKGWGKLNMRWNINGKVKSFEYDLPNNTVTTLRIG